MADTTPLVGGGQKGQSFVDAPGQWLTRWFCQNPRDNCFLVTIVAGGIIALVGAFALPIYVVPIVGGLCLAAVSNRIWALRNLAAEIDRFGEENERLETTQARLEGEVQFLGQKKNELTGHVNKLQGTVGDLQNVSEGLQNELDQFQKLKGNIEKFATETGQDVKKILGEANKILAKMERMTNQNERALLGKIAQDVEFLDKDTGMQKAEFDDFFSRMPTHLQARFRALGLTFEKVAGEDGVIDFMEIEDMIDKLMAETDKKIQSIKL